MQKDKDIEIPLPSIPIEKDVINKKDCEDEESSGMEILERFGMQS
jgi:hypothetical protein